MVLQWAEIWYYGLMFLTLLILLYIVFYSDHQKHLAPSFPKSIIFVLIVLIALFFANEPLLMYSDKWMYELDYIKAMNGVETDEKDLGFKIYTQIIALLTSSAAQFFFITAIIYMTGYYIFVQKYIAPSYQFILFFTIISSMGFYPYANNTLRAGLALSLFVFLLSRDYLLKVPTLLLLLLTILIHKSLLLPVAALIITLLYKRKDQFLGVWLVCLILSLAAGNIFVTLFGEFFSFADNRVSQYSSVQVAHYKTGFRWDFVAYSVAPIILARYYKKRGYSNPFYNQIISLYTIVNAFWLLLIRMPFSDRLATLSWFLIPVLLMYPLLTKRIFEKQHFWIAGVLLINALITFTLNMK